MKKSMIALATGLLFTSITMASFTPSTASTVTYVAPCGKVFTKQVARDDKKTNFYAQMLAKGSAPRTTSHGQGNSTN